MSKKELVEKIKGIVGNGIGNIHTLEDVNWVSKTQVCKRDKIASSLYRNYRVRLYSKDVTLEELQAIYDELKG